MTDQADIIREEQRAIEEQTQRELREIAELILDIRRRTGFGRITIVFEHGHIHEMECAFRLRPAKMKKDAIA